MKRLWWLLVLWISVSSARAMQRVNVLCSQTGTVNTSGIQSTNKAAIIYPGCLISVYMTGTANLATIYADNNSTPLSNPFTADTQGRGAFYAATGRYDITISGGGMPAPYTFGDVLVQDVSQVSGGSSISGTGPPTVPCSATNQGQIYTDITNGHIYSCTGSTWISSGGSAPVGNPMEVQINNSGSFGSATGVTYDGSGGLNAKGFNAFRYSSQWAVPAVTGANGSKNAQAPNITVIADPAYNSSTEITNGQSSSSQTYFSANPFHYVDNRNGYQLDWYRNPQYGNIRPLNLPTVQLVPSQIGHEQFCLFDYASPIANTQVGCASNAVIGQNPGSYWGATANTGFNPASGVATGGQNETVGTFSTFSDSATITRGIGISVLKNGIGDVSSLYSYLHFHGGAIGSNDENGEGIVAFTAEDPGLQIGTCSTGCTTGSTLVKISLVPGSNAYGVGRYWYDTSTILANRTITNIPSNPNPGLGGLTAVTLNTTITPSTAWGTIVADVNTPPTAAGCYYGVSNLTSVANASGGNTVYTGTVTNGANNALANCAVNIQGFSIGANNGPFTVSASTATTITVNNSGGSAQPGTGTATVYPFAVLMTFSVNNVNGTFSSSGLVCFSGNFHEQSNIVSFQAPLGGSQQIVVPVRRPHINGSYVFQGGMCGSGLEITANTFNGNKYLYDVVGSTDSVTLQVGQFLTGNINSFPLLSNNYSYYWSSVSIPSTFSCTGTLCSGNTTTTTIGNYSVTAFQGSKFVFSGFTSSTTGNSNSLNTSCTNLQWSNTTSFTCTIAGLPDPTTTTSTAGTATLGLGAVALWPIAESLDTQNESTTPPQKDGTITLEPNVITFASGHPLYESNHYSGNLFSFRSLTSSANPFLTAEGLHMEMNGKASAANGIDILNNEATSTYTGLGGHIPPPTAFLWRGPYGTGIFLNNGPAKGNGAFVIGPTTYQYNDPTYFYSIFSTSTRNGVSTLNSVPYNAELDLYTAGPYYVNSGGTTFSGPTTLSSGSGLYTGTTLNYAPYSNNLRTDGSTTWTVYTGTGAGTGSTSCGTLFDDFGYPACSMTATSANFQIRDNPPTGYTALTAGGTYTIQARIQSPVSGITFQVGLDNNWAFGTTTTGDTLWRDYCFSIPAVFNGITLNTFANFQINNASGTLNISNIVVRPGPACGPPIMTQANQVLTPTRINNIYGGTITGTIASGTIALSPGSITSGSCATNATATATNALSTDSFSWSFQGVPDATWGEIIMHPYIAANLIGFQICNPPGGGPITPVTSTVNWKVTR